MPNPIDVIPGMVLRGRVTHEPRVIINSTSFYAGRRRLLNDGPIAWSDDVHEVIVDPRTAEPLPNPFGIKPGDRVRRTERDEGIQVETSFKVQEIDDEGYLIPAGASRRRFQPFGFHSTLEPERLPAGTVMRSTSTPHTYLRTVHGYIVLGRGYETRQGHVVDNDVRHGRLDVIWLP